MTIRTTTVSGNRTPPGQTAVQVFRRSERQTERVADFSGTWTTDPSHLTVVDAVNYTPKGWQQFLEELRRTSTYDLSIAQTSDQLAITFPGASSNFLTASYQVDSPDVVSVRDHGDYWVKTIAQSRWSDSVLTLTATRQTDWWKDTKPENVTRQDAQTDTMFALRLNPTGTEMTMDVKVADEKGWARYRQVFKRKALQPTP